MITSTKNKLANMLASSNQVNKKVLDMKSSWDKIDSMLKTAPIAKKKTKH